MIILKAKGIKKAYKEPTLVEVLQGVSLEVTAGESIAIMGKSGEGKSTLLHILGALEEANLGEVELCGKSLTHHNAAHIRNQHIGFIFQSFHLLEDYTVLENVTLPLRIARKKVSLSVAMELLEMVGLKERAHFLAKFLSGGEKQRVAIARALCNNPDLILADEPTGNLDRMNSRAIHDLLMLTSKKYKKALIVVTHDQELASLCDRILILKEGLLECSS